MLIKIKLIARVCFVNGSTLETIDSFKINYVRVRAFFCFFDLFTILQLSWDHKSDLDNFRVFVFGFCGITGENCSRSAIRLYETRLSRGQVKTWKRRMPGTGFWNCSRSVTSGKRNVVRERYFAYVYCPLSSERSVFRVREQSLNWLRSTTGRERLYGLMSINIHRYIELSRTIWTNRLFYYIFGLM